MPPCVQAYNMRMNMMEYIFQTVMSSIYLSPSVFLLLIPALSLKRIYFYTTFQNPARPFVSRFFLGRRNTITAIGEFCPHRPSSYGSSRHKITATLSGTGDMGADPKVFNYRLCKERPLHCSAAKASKCYIFEGSNNIFETIV